MNTFWSTSWGWALKLSGWMAVFLLPVKSSMIAAVVLVISDLLFGVWAALKKGETFSSKKLRQTPVKLVGYLAGLVLSHVAETYMLPELPLVKMMSGLIASTEMLSLYESLSTITGVPFVDLAKKLFNKSGDKAQ